MFGHHKLTFNNSTFVGHIFPNLKVTFNESVHNFWHHFLARFFMAFYMAQSILLGVLALKTNLIEASDWLLEILR